MTNSRRVSTLLLSFLGVIGFVVFLKKWEVAALAAVPDTNPASGFGVNLLYPAGIVLALIVAAALIHVSRGLIMASGYRRSTARFLKKAEGSVSGDRTVTVVSVPGLERLPAGKGRKAMESLKLYLEGFIREGELCGRLDRFSYGLVLKAGDSAAFSQRLEILKQDAGFLYMAAYPGMRLTARVTACRECGQGFGDALRSARSLSAPEGPDKGLD